MKIATLKAVCITSLLAAAMPLAATQANVDTLKKEYTGVRTLELPARVAQTVSAAKPADRSSMAQDAVRAGLAVNGSSAPMIVGAIARSTPDVAAVSAATAASVQPKEISRITKASVGGAPAELESIVAALTKAQPGSFYTIGTAAVDLAPKSGDAILRGMGQGSSALKAMISRANPTSVPIKDANALVSVLKRVQTQVAILTKNGTSVATLLSSELSGEMLAQLPANMGTLALTAPTVGPPYTPGLPTPGEIGTANTFPAPPNSRNYSSP